MWLYDSHCKSPLRVGQSKHSAHVHKEKDTCTCFHCILVAVCSQFLYFLLPNIYPLCRGHMTHVLGAWFIDTLVRPDLQWWGGRAQGSDSIRKASKDLNQKVKGDVFQCISGNCWNWHILDRYFFHPGDVLRFWLSSFPSFLNPSKTRPLRTIEEGPRSKGNVWTLVVLLTGHLWRFGAVITAKFSYLTGRCTAIWAKSGLCTGIPSPKTTV